jgi:hypothetical protein
MDRRNFILKSGTIVTATALFGLVGCAPEKLILGTQKKAKRPSSNDFTQPILKAIAIGVNTANPHNTQPWKFKIISDTKAVMFVDETRLLPATDPPARQIHIGCGCFLETLRIGATGLGYQSYIDVLPEGAYSFEEIGEKPLAVIELKKETIQRDVLYDNIFTRRTNRLKYHPGKFKEGTLERLVSFVNPKSSTILFKDNDAELKQLNDMCFEAMKIEVTTYRTMEENRIWLKRNQKTAAKERDGIDLKSNGMGDIPRFFSEKLAKADAPKYAHEERYQNMFLKSFREKLDSSSALAYFVTENNELADWIKCGMDFTRFNLAADKSGIALHHLNQVLQEYDEMNAVRTSFETFVNVKPPKKVQLVLRLGRADEIDGFSFRRRLEDLILT